MGHILAIYQSMTLIQIVGVVVVLDIVQQINDWYDITVGYIVCDEIPEVLKQHIGYTLHISIIMFILDELLMIELQNIH